MHDPLSRARHLRRNLTWHEQLMWSMLRNRRFAKFKFRRQVTLGNFIVDFVCFERRLVIELDGAGHYEQQEYDADRTAWLESQGFRVVRFWNQELSEDIVAVEKVIWEQLNAVGAAPSPPAPLPRRGEG